jgi:hypothetical protein
LPFAFPAVSSYIPFNSQGGAEFPTGGTARERFSFQEKVSRSGEIPGPTVKVRMKENERNRAVPFGAAEFCVVSPYPL